MGVINQLSYRLGHHLVEVHHKDQKALPDNFEPSPGAFGERNKSGHFTAAKKKSGGYPT